MGKTVKIQELISEYSALTGRPVATLTIAEYIELKKYATEAEVNISTIPNNYATTEKEEKPTTSQISADEESSIVKIEEMPKSDNPKKKEPISSAFMMMRTISG